MTKVLDTASPEEWLTYQTISTAIEALSQLIPPLPAPPVGVEDVDGSHSFYVIGLAHALTSTASIHLRSNIPDDIQIFQQECLFRNSAIQQLLRVTRALEDRHYKFLDPIFGVRIFFLHLIGGAYNTRGFAIHSSVGLPQ